MGWYKLELLIAEELRLLDSKPLAERAEHLREVIGKIEEEKRAGHSNHD